MKRVIPFLAVILIGAALFYHSCIPRPGEVFETWETSNEHFKIQIVARRESNGFPVGGAYYTVRSGAIGSDVWRDVMTFRHDDPNEIPKDQTHFVNQQIAYVYLGWMYAVTTDAGKTWSVWNAEKDLPDWDCCNYGLIKQVTLTPEGQGKMTLNVISGRKGEVLELQTKDYGRHWSAVI